MRSVIWLAASVVVACVILAAGFGRHSRMSPSECRGIVGGQPPGMGMCYSSTNCNSACARVGNTGDCNQCQNGVGYVVCQPGKPTDYCMQTFPPPAQFCGTIFCGLYRPASGTCYSPMPTGSGPGCLQTTGSSCAPMPTPNSNNPCGS